ncbi:MAG: NAD(P)H-dependent oxidoreductase subunit E [Clostridium argentinense]|uniref:NAD(P)H-dependent oxidoreductase subunit E n=1 Tax=Clostridium faecium TaxID=2762223 RepID=A0ABR8YSV2_9CLOT|nr:MULTISPECIES: NAD(P)H-dependent oxidoreductase subunit E [Clostridium]MBD8047093.1 NAD(P)H-dependent oxidoreductase subunit E [Clostridium faecium]MBS5824568.1 NAD(P)H-dependent oxidoreductase subunit E [Clostridium argentinense]MDU1348377.1 NAD(P)H-dependent oxidoreductase subunit E [Clostridium argentinense]
MVVKVCVGSACYVKGSHKVIKEMQRLIEENRLKDKVELKAAFCLGNCTKAVSVIIDDSDIYTVDPDSVEEFFNSEILKKVM